MELVHNSVWEILRIGNKWHSDHEVVLHFVFNIVRTWPVFLNVPRVSGFDAVVCELPVLLALEDVVASVARAEHRVDATVAAQVCVISVWKNEKLYACFGDARS